MYAGLMYATVIANLLLKLKECGKKKICKTVITQFMRPEVDLKEKKTLKPEANS